MIGLTLGESRIIILSGTMNVIVVPEYRDFMYDMTLFVPH